MAARKSKRDDKIKALTIAALKRAIAVLEGSMGDKSVKPDEGGYPVAMKVAVKGDITVGKAAAPGDDREVPTLNAAQVFAGLIGSKRGPKAKADTIAKAVEAAAAMEDEGVLRNAMAEADTLIAAACREHGLTEMRPTPGRAGAVSGKPAVTVNGSHGSNTISVEVSAA